MAEAEWSESSEIEKLKKEINQLKKQDTKKPAKEKTEVNLICEKIQSIIGERMDKLEEKTITIEKNQTVGGQKNSCCEYCNWSSVNIRINSLWESGVITDNNIYQWKWCRKY